MAFASGKPTLDIKTLDEFYLANRFLNIKKIPCVINSPLRNDKHPSFAIFSKDGMHVRYKDFATGDTGSIFDLLQKVWNLSFKDMLDKISENTIQGIVTTKANSKRPVVSRSKIECKIREWKKHDFDYWNQFGITEVWLKYAEIYPVSHIFITKPEGERYTFIADKYAYAYVEHKENNTAVKIYQPYNKKQSKWLSGFDGSVISLWTKIPETGDRVVICSSVKDALCLWCNLGIPAIAVQGEGYAISDTAKDNLLSRYKKVYILFDNDEAGIQDGIKLSQRTGFTNLKLPKVNDAKDIAELYQKTNKQEFRSIILKLFENEV